ncbi:cytokine receptor family member B16 [Scomber japonicus]|uniref:cytokine receptor family member B16 n=1 Tax=Scomber japonicus TaxID=13676 RepID=UPI002304F559|nr:cytokine receptor family member B16 [Scomber japonicus]
MMMMMILLDLTNYVWMLPSPSSVSMESVDMRHTLRWLPLQPHCNSTVLYSVQFQGEFELMFLNGSWVDAPECQKIRHTHCDLTFDLGSDSDYNLRVQGQCSSQPSPWTQLSRPFNRRKTVLTVPKMSVKAVGDALQVSVEKLPHTAVVKVMVWKKGEELQPDVYMTPAEQMPLLVAALQEGAEYCVRAQTVLDAQLHSSSSDPLCVFITDSTWKQPITVAVTVIIMAGLLFAVFWSIIHCRPDACQTYFQKEPLPHSLRSNWDVQIPSSVEEEELCKQIHVVPAHLEDQSTELNIVDFVE